MTVFFLEKQLNFCVSKRKKKNIVLNVRSEKKIIFFSLYTQVYQSDVGFRRANLSNATNFTRGRFSYVRRHPF